MTQEQFEKALRKTHKCVEMAIFVDDHTVVIVMYNRMGQRVSIPVPRRPQNVLTLWAAENAVDDNF